MEEVNKIQQLNSWLVQLVSSRCSSSILAGLGLVIAVGGLAALSPSLALVLSAVVLLLALTSKRPQLITYGLTFLLPLTGGLARGGVIPLLRISQALVVLGFMLMLANAGKRSKNRLTMIDLAFALYFLTGSVFPVLSMYYHGQYLNLF
ncbi:MAG: hypothetical protein ACXWPS_13240, partial [Ktedonobacteraceae bacterium]